MLLQEIDASYRGAYDFFYLPIDFKNKCNVGYAFINFMDYRRIVPFFREFNAQRWKNFNSEKVSQSLCVSRRIFFCFRIFFLVSKNASSLVFFVFLFFSKLFVMLLIVTNMEKS